MLVQFSWVEYYLFLFFLLWCVFELYHADTVTFPVIQWVLERREQFILLFLDCYYSQSTFRRTLAISYFSPVTENVKKTSVSSTVMTWKNVKAIFEWRVHWNFVHWSLFSVNGFTENAEAIFYFQQQQQQHSIFSEGFTETMGTEIYFQWIASLRIKLK